MIPDKLLPYSDEFESPDQYVDSLLHFVHSSEHLLSFCGGVHILDFFTSEPSLFQSILPPDWQAFFLAWPIMDFLDFLMRDDLDDLSKFSSQDSKRPPPPESLVQYVRDCRRHMLRRDYVPPRNPKQSRIERAVAAGMQTKKVHEVTHFADYVDKLCGDLEAAQGRTVTHLVDFGSGRNYLGRALASAPYNRRVVAVEGREANIAGARDLDVRAGLATRARVARNKKLYMDALVRDMPEEKLSAKAVRRLQKASKDGTAVAAAATGALVGEEAPNFTPPRQLKIEYSQEEGKGSVRYVSGRLESGDLTDVVAAIEQGEGGPDEKEPELGLVAISIHSCGNLSHHGVRSLIMNPSIQAVAIVGCCYNLVTEKLGPPTHKVRHLRPSLQPLNGNPIEASDPQGFPMSSKFTTYNDGIRLNITARMMACQAPQNWTTDDTHHFLNRHFFRAVLQKIFLDRGVISRVYHGKNDGDGAAASTQDGEQAGPLASSTNPIIIGSLRKQCYVDFRAYVRGAVDKLTTQDNYSAYATVVQEKMADISDDEIEDYMLRYGARKQELATMWSLMAFSAGVVESLIVADRWQFLREHPDLVAHCWVETVFDYKLSPRNLVVVGVRR